jgi:hypothetical protein
MNKTDKSKFTAIESKLDELIEGCEVMLDQSYLSERNPEIIVSRFHKDLKQLKSLIK